MMYPCHKKPKKQWCDRDGPGGFMGHTCVKTKMKKSHIWDEIELVNARCPHCGAYEEYYGLCEEGQELTCKHCNRKFELGKQK